MRLSCKIKLQKGANINRHFRQELLYLIKESIIRSGADGALFYKRWYSFNRPKPFTFSAFFPLSMEGERRVLSEDYFNFLFSTNHEEFLIRVYSGLLNLSSTGFKLFGSEAKVERYHLLPEKKFLSNRAKFKTISPILLRNKDDGQCYLYPVSYFQDAKKFKYWTGVEEKDFVKTLTENIKSITGSDVKVLSFNINSIVPVVCGSKNTSHQFIAAYPGIKAHFELEASPETLKTVYDIGIGARRSEGFGMLEVS